MHYDGTATAGYYPTDTVGEHTYLFIARDDGSEVALTCYGGARKDGGNKNVYPATLWSPYIVGSRSVGKEVRINTKLAVAIATYQHGVKEIRARYDRRSGGWMNLGDCSGLIYGVSGVCHQMCNRILTATQPVGSTLYAPVNWPPSLSATYWTYGFTGAAPAARPFTEADLENFHDTELAHLDALKNQLRFGHLKETRAPRVEQNLLRSVGPQRLEGYDDALQSKIVAEDMGFHKVKRDLDHELLAGRISHGEYAERTNAAFANFATSLANALARDDYRKIFGTDADAPRPALVDPALMPEDYRTIGNALRL